MNNHTTSVKQNKQIKDRKTKHKPASQPSNQATKKQNDPCHIYYTCGLGGLWVGLNPFHIQQRVQVSVRTIALHLDATAV